MPTQLEKVNFMNISTKQLEEYIDEIAEDLNSGNFRAVYERIDPRNENITEMLYDMGIDVLAQLPDAQEDIKHMKVSLSNTQDSPYYGAQLAWLIEGYGTSKYRYLYLYYFKHDQNYKWEQLESKYSWYGDSNYDYYICLKDRWDIDKFKQYLDNSSF